MTFKVLLVALVALIVLNLSTAAPPPSSEYIGCCKDGTGGVRDLPNKLSSAITSNQQCQTLCGNSGYAFAGTQNGNECWCGYNRCSQGAFADKYCSRNCTDSTQSCGGPSRNTVYKVPTRYIGCIQDSTSARSLPYSAYASNTKNTPNDCVATCRRARYLFAGVQMNDCWCGSSLSSLRFVNQADCTSPCSGNSTVSASVPTESAQLMNYIQLYCGGNLRNGLWRV